MGEVTIRSGRDGDELLLPAFWAVAGENAGRPADRPEAVRALLDRDPEAVLVAEADGQVVGTVIAGWDGWRANLYRLAVHPDQRGRGIARRLLGLAEERVAGFGTGRVLAMVLDDNHRGQQLWRGAGYQPQTDWSRWVKRL